MFRIIIGLGNKARQGKDIAASYISSIRKNVNILHLADELYNEVKLPSNTLIKRENDIYHLYDKNTDSYIEKSIDEVPTLHSIFEKRAIDKYEKMIDKDPEILQFWGTNFRRQQNENYWIEQLDKKLKDLELNSDNQFNEHMPQIILIPDLRFKNELEYIKQNNGYFIRITRVENDKQYIDDERSKDHISETELDDIEEDYCIYAFSGDFKKLFHQIGLLISLIIYDHCHNNN